jgi:hypothetical protein
MCPTRRLHPIRIPIGDLVIVPMIDHRHAPSMKSYPAPRNSGATITT